MKPDIVRLEKNAQNPVFDMILWAQTLRNFGVILNFAEFTITIDHHEILMRRLDAFSSVNTRKHVLKRKTHNTQHSTKFSDAPPDLVAIEEATDRAMRILDANYEKTDLPKVLI